MFGIHAAPYLLARYLAHGAQGQGKEPQGKGLPKYRTAEYTTREWDPHADACGLPHMQALTLTFSIGGPSSPEPWTLQSLKSITALLSMFLVFTWVVEQQG